MTRGRFRPWPGAPPLRDACCGIGAVRHVQAHAALPGRSLPDQQSRAGRPTARRDGRVPGTCSTMPERAAASRSANRCSASCPRGPQLVVVGSGDGLRAVHVEKRQEPPPKASPRCGMKRAPRFAIGMRDSPRGWGEVSTAASSTPPTPCGTGRIRRRVQRQRRAVCRRGFEGARPPASPLGGYTQGTLAPGH